MPTTPPTSTLAELSAYIVATHHEYLRRSMPSIAAELSRLRQDSGPSPLLDSLTAVFAAMCAELELHMHKEEIVLFPFIVSVERALAEGTPRPQPPFGSVANPIRMMEQEHDSAVAALTEIRRLTEDFTLHRPISARLAEFDADLQQHIRLENDILFPRAMAMERGA